MKGENKTKEQLISELAGLRHRITELEAIEAERKSREEISRNAEETYRNLVNMSPDVMYSGSPKDGAFLFLNEAFEKITGWSRAEWIGRPFMSIVHPDDLPLVMERFQQGLAGETQPPFEARFLCKSGDYVVGEVIGTPHVVDGKVVEGYGFVRDITELKQAAEALRESEEKYRTIFENARDEIMYLDKYGKIIDVNKRAEDYFGYKREELIGKNFTKLNVFHMKDLTRLVKFLPGIARGKVIPLLELEVKHKDGTPVLVEASTTLIKKNGKTEGFLAVIRDITERKRAEGQIKHLNLVLRAIRNVNQLITREKDREKLIQGVCDILIETRGYYNAWVALLDESGKLVTYAESGLGKDFLPMVERLKRGELTACAQKALEQSEIVLTENPPSICADCPLARMYSGRGAMTVRLEAGGKTCGILSISIPIDYIADAEETTLLKEVSRDIAMALRSIEVEQERDWANEALRESEEVYRSLINDVLDGSAVGIFILDRNFKIVWVNRALERYFGVRREDIIGADKRNLIRDQVKYVFEDSEGFAQTVLATYDNNTYVENFQCHVLPDGERKERWLEHWSQPVATGLYTGGRIEHYTDITERKWAEEALRASEQNFHSSLDSSPLGIRIVTAEGELLYANQAILDMYGYSSFEELKGVPAKQRYTPESYAAHRKRVEDRKLGKPVPSDYEISIVRRDGEVRHLAVFRREVIWNSQTQFQALYQDITERKWAEEALRESEARYRTLVDTALEGICITDEEETITFTNPAFAKMLGYTDQELVGQSLRKLVSEDDWQKISSETENRRHGISSRYEVNLLGKKGLARSVIVSAAPFLNLDGRFLGSLGVIMDITERKLMEEERLKFEKLESIGTLAGGIAHDFNNLLTGIMGNIGLAKRYIEPKSKAEERLLEAEKASERARDLTQQLLTFAKSGAPVKKLVTIGEELEESATFALRGSNVKCEFSFPDDLWSVEVDEGQMNQVITNLIINADEAMPEGGIINIGARNTIIKSKGALPLPKGNYVEIMVKDCGIGIPKEYLGRIFDPYFTTKQKGSGLGLATTYSIIKNHDGHITVQSKRDIGTTFHIYLPATTKPVHAEKEVVMKAPMQGKGRILVMDDEEIIREMLNNMLRLTGYEVELTSDGAEAIERYAEAKESGQPFDAVILDLTVPGGMGGKEAIKKLLEIDPNVMAIVSSGYSTDPIMSKFKKYGFSAVVTKPYSVGELERTLQRLLVRNK